jgi:hypothetical protein
MKATLVWVQRGCFFFATDSSLYASTSLVKTTYNSVFRLCSDEEASIIARTSNAMQKLQASYNNIGSEGMSALSNNLLKMEILEVSYNNGIKYGCACLGRLPRLKTL